MGSRVYRVVYEKAFLKGLKALDMQQARLILAWIRKNLDGTEDPRLHGKALKGRLKQYWRYRVGEYCLICEIRDKELVLILITMGDRKDIYR